MGELRCVDGSCLSVRPVLARDTCGRPYEVTLHLERDREPFGVVGQRCGYHLATLARDLGAARAVDDGWADAEDRFPEPPLHTALRDSWAADQLPREPELFAFRRRERGDPAGTGELRCVLRTHSAWLAGEDGSGQWSLTRRAVVDAWGAGGHGVRAVLTSSELARFLTRLLAESRRAGVDFGDVTASSAVRSSRATFQVIIEC